MANEVAATGTSGKTFYFLVRNNVGQVWNTVAAAFQTYATATYANYTVSMTEQGTASGYYAGSFPSAITAGAYSVVVKQQAGGSPAEGDLTVGAGTFDWNGTAVSQLSDAATSGQVGQFAPIRLSRGVQVTNFPIYLKQSADHVTPLTSGVVSGQISKDGAAFVAFQSGAFTERGNGFYTIQALTSGDLNCNTAAILFTAGHISGLATADPLPLTFVLQHVSGY